MPRVLISDKLSPAAVAIFRERGIDADVKTGLTPAELRALLDLAAADLAPHTGSTLSVRVRTTDSATGSISMIMAAQTK